MTKEFKEFNITPEQFIVLVKLFEEEGISQMELAIKLDKDKNTVKAMVDNLEKKNYILKRNNEIDRRAYSLFTTEKAKEIIPILKEREKKITQTLLLNLELEEMEKTDSTLKKIRENVE